MDDRHCKLDILSEFVYVLAVGAAEAFDNLGRNNGFAVLKTICVVNDPKILIDQNNASLIDLCNLCNLLPDLLAVVIDQVTGGNDQIGDHGSVRLQFIDTLGHQSGFICICYNNRKKI